MSAADLSKSLLTGKESAEAKALKRRNSAPPGGKFVDVVVTAKRSKLRGFARLNARKQHTVGLFAKKLSLAILRPIFRALCSAPAAIHNDRQRFGWCMSILQLLGGSEKLLKSFLTDCNYTGGSDMLLQNRFPAPLPLKHGVHTFYRNNMIHQSQLMFQIMERFRPALMSEDLSPHPNSHNTLTRDERLRRASQALHTCFAQLGGFDATMRHDAELVLKFWLSQINSEVNAVGKSTKLFFANDKKWDFEPNPFDQKFANRVTEHRFLSHMPLQPGMTMLPPPLNETMLPPGYENRKEYDNAIVFNSTLAQHPTLLEGITKLKTGLKSNLTAQIEEVTMCKGCGVASTEHNVDTFGYISLTIPPTDEFGRKLKKNFANKIFGFLARYQGKFCI